MKKIFFAISVALIFVSLAHAQIPITTLVQIAKAEDARRYDKTLDDLMANPNAAVRSRAAIAAGRIGDEKSIPVLTTLLESDQSDLVRSMAAFAIGEVESVKGADAILKTLKDSKTPDSVRARAVEAAGKIAAANAKTEKARALGDAILNTLQTEGQRGAAQNRDVVLLGITAALRAKPIQTGSVVAKFLTSGDPRIRSDAANTLARVRAKNASAALRAMLVSDNDAVARSNAANALGSAEDKDAFNILLTAAADDTDLRVRVSAIRSLGRLKDVKAAGKLLDRGEKLVADYKRSKFTNPVEKNELIEIATVLGRLLALSGDASAVKFLGELALLDDGRSAEISVARMRVLPGDFDNSKRKSMTWRELSTGAEVVAELATIDPKTDEVKKMKAEAPDLLKAALEVFSEPGAGDDKLSVYAMPDYLQAYAKFKPADLSEVLRASLEQKDVQIRATAAGLLAEQPASKETVEALRIAFTKSLFSDNDYNDAQLAILDALFKLDKQVSVGALIFALNASDYLVRKKAFELSNDKDLQKEFPNILKYREEAMSKRKDQVLPYTRVSGSKLGQLLNTEANYRRAVSRKNGSVKAVLATEKGAFTIIFSPEEAPLTVDNFIKLARSGYFNGLEVHRVVPNFVMQDGDPRGDGIGGPGWSIRCEVNMLPYDRGAVGMALSGKDTGGSQWFVTHAPQPHLDGGYTVFGHVNETDMKVVDSIVRGDKILTVKIVEGILPRKGAKSTK